MRQREDLRPLCVVDARWRRPLGLAFASALALGACGSDTDDLDEGREPSEEGTEIIPGEGGPVD